jgi:hypothetical protein
MNKFLFFATILSFTSLSQAAPGIMHCMIEKNHTPFVFVMETDGTKITKIIPNAKSGNLFEAKETSDAYILNQNTQTSNRADGTKIITGDSDGVEMVELRLTSQTAFTTGSFTFKVLDRGTSGRKSYVTTVSCYKTY